MFSLIYITLVYRLGNISSEILSGAIGVFFSEVWREMDVQKYIDCTVQSQLVSFIAISFKMTKISLSFECLEYRHN